MKIESRFFGWSNYLTCVAASWLGQQVEFERRWFQRAGLLLRDTPHRVVHVMLEDDLIRHAAAHTATMSGQFSPLEFLELQQEVNWSEIAEIWIQRWRSESGWLGTTSDLKWADELQEGEMVDVSHLAKYFGFRLPVLMTAAAWKANSAIPDGADYQTPTERVRDVLNLLRPWLRSKPGLCDGAEIRVSMFIRTGDVSSDAIEIHGVCEPNDNGELVVKLRLPDEC